MASNAQFSRQLKSFVKLSSKTGQKDTRKIALSGLRTVQVESRVDEGTLRGNWNVALDSVDTGIDEGAGSDTQQGAVDTEAFNKGSIVISNFKNGQQINITNNMPYAGKLNTEDAYITKGLKNMERAAKQLRDRV